MTIFAAIGRGLRSQYDELTAQPMPQRLATLLQQLQEPEQRMRPADERVGPGALLVTENGMQDRPKSLLKAHAPKGQ